MSEIDQHPPQAIMKGWLTPGSNITNESFVKTQARNIAICKANDSGTELKVIARQNNLHNSSVTRILAENGRTPNVSPTPAGALDAPAKRPHQYRRPVASYDPQQAANKFATEDLLVAILKMCVRNDLLPGAMSLPDFRAACANHGVVCPA